MKKIILVIFIAGFLFACNNEKKDEAPTTTAPETTASPEKPPVELLPPATADVVKASNAAFEKADLDGFTANMADNVMYRFSGGDSLVGKQAVKDYYAGRWKVIESIKFSDDIFLPLNANQSPNGGATSAGKWILSWHKADVKYKNGKSISFLFHVAQHLNDAGKSDQVTEYIDRAPIMAASK